MKDDKSKSEVDILNELNKGIKMGMDSISNVMPSVKDDNFKEILLSQYNKYNGLLNKVDTQLQKFDTLPKDLPAMQKAMGFIEVKLNTTSDNSISHIAEMMMQGTNMGIIKGIKLLHNNPDITKDTQSILSDFVNYQEDCIETLKEYL
jgi:hypothetical protein